MLCIGIPRIHEGLLHFVSAITPFGVGRGTSATNMMDTLECRPSNRWIHGRKDQKLKPAKGGRPRSIRGSSVCELPGGLAIANLSARFLRPRHRRGVEWTGTLESKPRYH